MNTELKQLYGKYWDNLDNELKLYMARTPTDLPTYPLLINAENEEEYLKADIRVMIFGQETNDWGGVWGNETISQLITKYNNFFYSDFCYEYGGHFWNAIGDLYKSLLGKYPDKKICLVWNNILKIGKAKKKGTPSSQQIAIEKQWFPVIKPEIKILDPNIIIFFTGPYYDKYLQMEFNDIEFSAVPGWDKRQISRVVSEFLPINAFRTYHPGYLWRNNYYGYKEKIITQINNI